MLCQASGDISNLTTTTFLICHFYDNVILWKVNVMTRVGWVSEMLHIKILMLLIMDYLTLPQTDLV